MRVGEETGWVTLGGSDLTDKENLFEDGHLRSGKLSKEELRSKIGYLDGSIPTLGSSSGDN